MKQGILILISCFVFVSLSAAVPDLSSISDEQKMAFIKSLSASDRERLIKELQSGSEEQGPLEQPEVVLPKEKTSDELSAAEEDLSNIEYGYDEEDQYKADVQEKKELTKLKPFGYDLFSGTPTTFAPATEIPVPQNYVIGPGDSIQVFTYGNESTNQSYTVDRNGSINISDIGPIVVAGLSFTDVRQAIIDRYETQKIGVKASVTMGELRSIRIFILGEANRSGSYTVSALSTMTNALFVSGGVKPIGSLRNIQLKRNGSVVSTLDLYDLLLKGDTRKDVRLQPGDVIFIPTIGDQVTVSGNVKRPAIYETKHEHHLQEFVKLAGGILPNAQLDDIVITRFAANKERTILNTDYTSSLGKQIKIQAGDVIKIGEVLDEIENSVGLIGHVKRDGASAFFPGMRVLDLVHNKNNLKDKVDLEYALVRRLMPPSNEIKVLSFNLGKALSQPMSADNVPLQANDSVYIFELGVDREEYVTPLIEELQQQSKRGDQFKQVSIAGRIKVPGYYPLEANMTITDLLRAGGGLTEASYGLMAELTRAELDVNSEYQTKHIDVDIKRLIDGDPSADLVLQSRDRLFIKEVPNWADNKVIEILGQVSFPGEYQIKSGETLGQVMQRAGGLTDNAFPRGALFIRESLQQKERKYLLSLADKLEKDIALLSIEKESSAVELGQSLLKQLRETEAAGRLVIDLNAVMANVGNESRDVILQDGDKLYVPEKTQEVTVVGEVQFPTSHLHDGIGSRNAFIQNSGGFTSKADVKRVYVVRADGRVVNREYTGWFSRGDFAEIQAGDTIVVPLNADRVRPLTLWSSVTQILSQIGIFAASAKTVGIL